MKPWSVTIQMKAINQYFRVVLFVILWKVVLSFESVDETQKTQLLTNEMVVEQYFPVVLFNAIQGSSIKLLSLWMES